MRILVFASYFYPHKGGSEDYVYQLVKGLAGRSFEVTVVTCNTENVGEYENIDGFSVYRIPCWNLINGQYPVPKPTLRTYKILKEISKKDYDHVNTHTRFWILCLVGMFIAKHKKTRLIHVEHGSVHSVVQNGWVDLCAKIYDHTFGSLLIKNADVLIGVSDGAVNFIKHLGGRGEPYKISKGLNLGDYKLKDKSTRQKIGVESKDKLVIYVGRLIYGKGVQDLITAFKKIQKDSANVKLMIVGDGEYREKLEQLKGDDVIFLGEVDHDSVIKILNSSDIFVNPSYSEGLPTTVLEAGAVGLPVIATDVGGTSEVIINNETGILIQKQDINTLVQSLITLLEDTKSSKKLATNLKKRVWENYNHNRMINEFCKVYSRTGLVNES